MATDYTELIKALRNCVNDGCEVCDYYLGNRCREMQEKAANAIAEAAAVKACTPRWIPVTEKLPEEDKLVLVWRNNGLPYLSRRIDLSYWVGLGRDAGVTHWMPLPEPPNEETE